MTTNEMRSNVCKRANELMKSGYTRSGAFKMAWAEVKNSENTIKTSDLAIGNVVRVEYGCAGNFVTFTVEYLSEVKEDPYEGKYIVVRGHAKDGMRVGFWSSPESRLEIAA